MSKFLAAEVDATAASFSEGELTAAEATDRANGNRLEAADI
jgi:hypothetical protein